jgi:hypothetical protein
VLSERLLNPGIIKDNDDLPAILDHRGPHDRRCWGGSGKDAVRQSVGGGGAWSRSRMEDSAALSSSLSRS